ncbi:MAG: aspartate/glutamate racemase family protein, partial [Clostridia bacterium]|nr:aspartate/glutamate racemase family protein [Clostridia bacterium]
MPDNRPIGIFDSGLGGLTVLKAVQELLPNESLVYFGDSGRTPYGTKSPETVLKYTFQDINFLLEHQVKMIVIACNTASACSLDAVLKQYT